MDELTRCKIEAENPFKNIKAYALGITVYKIKNGAIFPKDSVLFSLSEVI